MAAELENNRLQIEQSRRAFCQRTSDRGKKFNQRIPADQAPQVQEQVDNYRRFQSLAEEYVTLSDEITRLESQDSGSKKNSSRRRLRTNGSGKPPLS